MYTSTRMTRFFKCTAIAVAALIFCHSVSAADTPTSNPPPQRGAALGLYSEDPAWSYVEMIDEMKAAGVNHVAVVVPYYLKNDTAVEIFAHPRFSVPMQTVERTVGDIRARGMEVMLFPILRVDDKSNGGWRGTLHPSDLDAFFANYISYILQFAKLAARLKIPIMSVGSELSTMDVHTRRWREVIAKVRTVYDGKLTYSANWDHYEEVEFFDALDFAGVTGYFELADKEKPGVDPPVEQLIHSWREVYMRLMRWQHRVGKPLILTEVGYLSQHGAAARPWNEGADEPIDLDLQRRCYEAVRRVWDGEKRLAGLYFWNWFGWGGPTSKEYTPRKKPAAAEVTRWYRSKQVDVPADE